MGWLRRNPGYEGRHHDPPRPGQDALGGPMPRITGPGCLTLADALDEQMRRAEARWRADLGLPDVPRPGRELGPENDTGLESRGPDPAAVVPSPGPGHPDRRRLENWRLMHNPGTGESFYPYPGQPDALDRLIADGGPDVCPSCAHGDGSGCDGWPCECPCREEVMPLDDAADRQPGRSASDPRLVDVPRSRAQAAGKPGSEPSAARGPGRFWPVVAFTGSLAFIVVGGRAGWLTPREVVWSSVGWLIAVVVAAYRLLVRGDQDDDDGGMAWRTFWWRRAAMFGDSGYDEDGDDAGRDSQVRTEASAPGWLGAGRTGEPSNPSPQADWLSPPSPARRDWGESHMPSQAQIRDNLRKHIEDLDAREVLPPTPIPAAVVVLRRPRVPSGVAWEDVPRPSFTPTASSWGEPRAADDTYVEGVIPTWVDEYLAEPIDVVRAHLALAEAAV